MRHSVLIYFFLFFVAVSLIGGSVLTTYTQFIEDGPLTEAKEVVIPKGKSLKFISKLLKKEGVIESPSVFELGVRASGNTYQIKAGEYSFPRHVSAKLVMDILIDGQTVARRFVVPEGWTSQQIIASMDRYKGLTGTVDRIPKNGTLLPETYNYSYGDSKESLVKRMETAMQETLKELWEKRDKTIPLKNPQEAVIMASVVEKETGKPAERPHIASVFYNRLNKKIKLQSDPTVIYAITNGELNMKRALTYNDLKYKSPYNTYVVYGLPVGAISNPGREAIQAVLNPMKTNDVYFVADGTGGHVFSPTYKAHQNNVNKWRKAKRNKKALETAKKTGISAGTPLPQNLPPSAVRSETQPAQPEN